MSYIQENLMPNEKVLFSARVHPAVLIPSVILLFLGVSLFIYGINLISSQNASNGIIAIFAFPMAGIFLLRAVLSALEGLITILTTEFDVTNRRVIAKRGFIRRHTVEILLAKVESIAVRQNVMGRLLNFGTVTITGTGGTKESFRAIAEPPVVRKKINYIVERYMQSYVERQQKTASVSVDY